MTKPIAAIGLPLSTNREIIANISDDLSRKMYDYHVIVYLLHEAEVDVKIEVFYEKDITGIEIDKLKHKVLCTMNNTE